MSILNRTDTSVVSQWWWTVDRWMLASLAAIAAIGGVLILATLAGFFIVLSPFLGWAVQGSPLRKR